MLRNRALRFIIGVGILFFSSGGLFAIGDNCKVTCADGHQESWCADGYWACIGFCMEACPGGGGLVGCSYTYPEITDQRQATPRASSSKERFL